VCHRTEIRFRAVYSGGINHQTEVMMPKGASPKREREFKKLETEFKKEHRYPGREEEVASRIVNKQRAEHGETKQSSSGGSKQSAKK
jgi:hypothetical protein